MKSVMTGLLKCVIYLFYPLWLVLFLVLNKDKKRKLKWV